MADNTARQQEFEDEVRKIRDAQGRRRVAKTSKRQSDDESIKVPCIILVDEKPPVQYSDETIAINGLGRPTVGPVSSVAFKYPQFGYPELHLSFMWHTKFTVLPFAHVVVHCSPQFVETAPICEGPSTNEYQLFCRNRKLPESETEANALLLNLFVQPDGVDVQVKDQVPSELKWHGDAAVQCFEDFKDTKSELANLKEPAKLEFIFRRDSPYRLDETIWFADSFVGEQASPLEPLAAKTMSSWKFTRENMLSPREAGFSGHDPAKMRFDNQQERSAKLAYATYFEQLYDEENRNTLETKLFRSHAIGVEATKYQGHYTEYLLTPEVNKSEDMNMMPRPGKEEFDIEVLVRCDAPSLNFHP
ncbi:hypothetical protein PG996_008968 [Apiospora saccharicola]|uniref:Uncharacterized protein n=1 Tax=Apiospora saccharicola TaxID=335842 RepID=A0ABR1UZG8_9PEZI